MQAPEADPNLYSLELEQAILGACLFDNSVLRKIETLLDADDFFDPMLGHIYSTMGVIAGQGRLSPVSLAHALSDLDDFGEMGGEDYLKGIARATVSTLAAPEYAKGIRDLANKRRLLAALQELTTCAADIDTTAPAFVNDAEAAILAAVKAEGRVMGSQNIGQQTSEWLSTVQERCQQVGLPGLSTGIGKVDHALGGLRSGALYIIAGRPGMGKSVLMTAIARAAIEAGQGAFLSSLEMPVGQLFSRMAADMAYEDGPISYGDIDRGALNLTQQQRLARIGEKLNTSLLCVSDRSGLTAAQIQREAERARRRLESKGHKLGVIVVDYLGLIRADKHLAGNVVAAEGQKALAMKELAREMEVPVVALCQLSRGVEGRESKRPTLADLRWSGDIEAHADVVSFLYRPAYYIAKEDASDPMHDQHDEWRRLMRDKANVLDFIIEKNRHGPTGAERLWVDIASAAVRDEDPGHFNRRAA